MHKELVTSININSVSTDNIEYISFEFETMTYEVKFFKQSKSMYVDAICRELDNDNIDLHFSKWLVDNGLDYGIIYLERDILGVLYLGVSRDKINLGLLDNFRLFLESDHFKFKFKPEAGSI